MKKISVLLLAAALSLSLSACGSSSETTAAESPDAVTTIAAAPSLDGEYLEGTWEWQESMSPDSLTKMRSFKLKADGTGKILSFDGDKPDSSLTWIIEDHGSWSSVHLFSGDNSWNCNFELDGEYLVDLTGSDYFAKK